MSNLAHIILESTIGNVFGKDITCREPVHRCDLYQPGIMIEIGRTNIRVCFFFKSNFTEIFNYY